MRNDDKIRKSFDYLRDRAADGRTFTVSDLVSVTGWTLGTTEIYLSKKLSEVVEERSAGVFDASTHILDVPYRSYRDLFSQKNTLFAKYAAWVHPDVTTYEFFLPLSREDVLQAALDRLLYKDTIVYRLQQIGLDSVRGVFEQHSGETELAYLNRVADFAGDKFGGYSISHVSGRFRAADLMTKEDAAQYEKTGDHYIVDETTAVVRFILPHGATAYREDDTNLVLDDEKVKDEKAKTDWLFHNLFVDAVTHATTNQDQIWLLETGKNHRLFRYVSEDRD